MKQAIIIILIPFVKEAAIAFYLFVEYCDVVLNRLIET